MSIEYLGLSEINGSFVILEGVEKAAYEEIVKFRIDGNEKMGQVVEVAGDKAVVQVFEGTDEFSLNNTSARFIGKPMEIRLSEEILGRVFDGVGRPIDGLPPVFAEDVRDINGKPINPVSRVYPRNFIQTGISAIDGLVTLIRGQKLPIFTGNGLPNDQLAAQIVRQGSLGADSDEKFVIVFAAMGVKYDVADFFKRTFEESGALERVVMFLNYACIGHFDGHDQLCGSFAGNIFRQGGNSQQEGVSRLFVFRAGLYLRTGGHCKRGKGFRYPGADSHHAQ